MSPSRTPESHQPRTDVSEGRTEPRCVGYSARSRYPCNRDAVDTVIAGCVHEHIGPRALCQFHIDDIAHELMMCGTCLDSTDPHHCVLVAVPTRRKAHA